MNTTRRRHREAQVRQWFAMWLTKQDTGMVETLFAADAHYIESWGPEYHGRTNIQRWFAEWNTRGTVVQWDIGTFFHREDQAVVSWHFCAAMEDGTTQSFDGLSLLRWNDREEICFLQEFGCNQHRYDPYAQGDTPVFRDEKPLWF